MIRGRWQVLIALQQLWHTANAEQAQIYIRAFICLIRQEMQHSNQAAYSSHGVILNEHKLSITTLRGFKTFSFGCVLWNQYLVTYDCSCQMHPNNASFGFFGYRH